MTIAAWRPCAACQRPFALTRRQDHPAVFAPMVRCPPCRAAHRRALGRIRTQNWRLRQCDAQSAPTHAASTPAAVNGAQSHA